MKDTKLYEEILGIIKPWKVDHVELDKDNLEIRIHISIEDTTWCCSTCKQVSHIHQYGKERRWRHLDSCQFKTYIVASVPRVKCNIHGTQTIQIPWAEDQSRFTRLFERFSIDLLKECSIQASCELLRISWDEADGIKQRAVKRGVFRKKKNCHAHIGVDEKGFGKGQNYVTIVAATKKEGSATVEFISDGNSKKSLNSYWEQLNLEQIQAIKSISMDMSEAYQRSTYSFLPKASEKIVFDPFHISQHMNKAVNNVRKQESKYYQKKEDENPLKGTRQIWLYGKENLPDKYQLCLNNLIDKNLKTGRAWAIKEMFRDFWKCSSKNLAEKFFKTWYSWAIRSRLDSIKKVAKMIKTHINQILNYFSHKVTNAPLEGLNNKIQALIKKAYGYRNKERFKNDILFHCGGMNLYPV